MFGISLANKPVLADLEVKATTQNVFSFVDASQNDPSKRSQPLENPMSHIAPSITIAMYQNIDNKKG